MENRICVIIPTKERLNDFILFAESWVKTTQGYSTVVVGINEDDNTYDNLIKQDVYPFIWEKISPKPYLKILNELALKYSYLYKYVAFFEDDVTFNTIWEQPIINKLNELGKTGIVWTNDLHLQKKAMSVPFIRAEIIQQLGYMCPLEFNTQVADVYWLELGTKLGTLYYFEDIITEHRHYITGKRKYDKISANVDSYLQQDREYHDSEIYVAQLEQDFLKLKSWINLK